MAKAVPTSAIEGQNIGALENIASASANSEKMNMINTFMDADIVVQLVIVILIGMSFWSWTIFLDKLQTFRKIRKRMKSFEKAIWASTSLERSYEETKNTANNPMSRVFIAGMYEWLSLKDKKEPESAPSTQQNLQFDDLQSGDRSYPRRAEIKERIWHAMDSVRNKEVSLLEKNLGFLATVGSSAPFIGLFGTVWGIMNSFQAIAVSQNSTLAVVAPGIAEALFATAIGLFAAIPAVIFYNNFSTQSAIFSDKIDEFCDQFASLIARELDNS